MRIFFILCVPFQVIQIFNLILLARIIHKKKNLFYKFLLNMKFLKSSFTFFARVKKVNKESTPPEKLSSSFTSDFSGIAELTGLRPVQTCSNSFSEKPLQTRYFSTGIIKTVHNHSNTVNPEILVQKIKSY